jgi:hypothetical protein
MMRDESIEAASRAGNTPELGDRSTMVMGVLDGISGRRVSDKAVLSPNTPEPIMSMLESFDFVLAF